MRAVALVVALAGCADLAAIPAQQCGNNVLEAGEDCDDTSDPRCVACGWTCTTDADCLALPAVRDPSAYRCGVDHVCHAPGGQFQPTQSTQQPFDVDRMYVTDIDRDGIGDAVGLGSTSLVTRFGDTSARLDGSAATVTPDGTGFESIVDIDGDGSLDLVLPTHDGIVAFASPNHALAPYPFGIDITVIESLFKPVALIPLDTTHLGVIAATPPTGNGTLVLGTVDASLQHVQLLDLCEGDFDAGSFDASKLLVYDASTGNIAAVTAAFVANAGGTPKLCAFSIANVGGTITGVAAASIAAQDSAAFADFTGDHCPSLVTANAGLAAMQQYDSTRDGSGNCVFPATSLAMAAPTEPADALLVGSVPLVPGVPGGYATDALVTSDAIWAVGAGYKQLYSSDRPIDMVRAGDFNGDGQLDAVTASSTGPNFDMLMREQDTFLRLRIGTDVAPAHLVVGDFDGNRADDLLFIERLVYGDRMSAIYGTPDQPLPPVAVGEFYQLVSDVPVDLTDSYDPTNLVRDLAVLDQRPGDTNTTIEVLYGAPQRALLPFLDPQLKHASVFATVAAGHITSPSAIDMVTLDDDPMTFPYPYTLFAQDANGTVEFAGKGRRIQLEGVNDCTSGDPLCFDQARSVVWECGTAANNEQTCGPATSVVVVIDPADGVSTVFDPQCCGMQSAKWCIPTPASTSGPTPVGATITTPPVFADTDGDGALELVVASSTDSGAQIVSCRLDSCQTGASLVCTDVLAGTTIDGKCGGVTLGRVDPSGATAVVLECGNALYRLTHDATGYGVAPLLAQPLPFTPLAVAVGDVTGDAVDDLVVTTTVGSGVRVMQVYPQLTSRQVAP
ncbi:MAG TPA: VCBS repeat-containing protein [Kofleriaceae bacterium]|nr:VCBS repeat-containing protein [Kofleriaceae bacterium]